MRKRRWDEQLLKHKCFVECEIESALVSAARWTNCLLQFDVTLILCTAMCVFSQFLGKNPTRFNGLLQWCRSVLMDREDVEVTNFSSSWADGKALCYLFQKFFQDKLDLKVSCRHNFVFNWFLLVNCFTKVFLFVLPDFLFFLHTFYFCSG